MTIVLSTDASCDTLADSSITIGRLGEIDSRDPVTVTGQCSGGAIGSLVAVPATDESAEVAFRIVSAIGQQDVTQCVEGDPECIVARRALRFVANTPLRVPIVMRQTCAGVVCDETETCVDGQCAPATIDPAACVGQAGCDEGALGPASDPDDPAVPTPKGVEWTLALGGTGDHHVRTVAAAPNGTIFAAGNYTGSISLGDDSFSCPVTAACGFLANIGADGAPRWLEHYNSSRFSVVFDLVVDDESNAYVAGYFDNDIDFHGAVEISPNVNEAFVGRVNADRSLGWFQSWPSSGLPRITGLAWQGESLYTLGTFSGTLQVPEFALNAAPTDPALFLGKLNRSSGVPEEMIRAFGAGEHSGGALAVDDDGRVHGIAGFSGTFGFDVETPGAASETGGDLAKFVLAADLSELATELIGGPTATLAPREIAADGDDVCLTLSFTGGFDIPTVGTFAAGPGALALACFGTSGSRSHTFTGGGVVGAGGLAFGGSDDVWVGGYHLGGIEGLVEEPLGPGGAFLASLDREGNLSALGLYDGEGDDVVNDLARVEGGVVLAGRTSGALIFSDGVALAAGNNPNTAFITCLAVPPE